MPRQGRVLLSIDYVQCELRIMAHFSQDATLISLLQGEACPYTGIAARVQRKEVSSVSPRDRQIYKTVVLGILYGQGQKSLAAKLALTETQAASVISSFFSAFPKVQFRASLCVSYAPVSTSCLSGVPLALSICVLYVVCVWGLYAVRRCLVGLRSLVQICFE
jgi:hypothetical protein